MIRVAAVGDLHFGIESQGSYEPHAQRLREDADLLLVAGDLTRVGKPEEARVAADELAALPVPVLAVLGNHDYHADCEREVRDILESAGIRMLEGESATLTVDGLRVGIAGIKGFGGGFAGACASDFGEPEMKAFIRHTRAAAEHLEAALDSVRDADVRIALMHYAPVSGTLAGERPEIFPFLGSYLLAEAADRAGANLIVHGHAHAGTEHGITPAGIPVRNVAQPVLGAAYATYCLEPAVAAR